MTPHPLSDEIIPLPKPPPAAPEARPVGRRRGRFCGLLAIAILTLVGGAVCLWWQLRPAAAPPAIPPPVPPNIQDAEIRELIETTRQDVLDHRPSADAWGRLGMVLLAQLFDIDADRCFAEAARLDPGDARWPYARGLMALKRHPDNALPFLRQAIADESRPEILSDYSMQLAEALLERREIDEAEGLFHQWYDSDPNNLRAAYGLGLIALATRQRSRSGKVPDRRPGQSVRPQKGDGRTRDARPGARATRPPRPYLKRRKRCRTIRHGPTHFLTWSTNCRSANAVGSGMWVNSSETTGTRRPRKNTSTTLRRRRRRLLTSGPASTWRDCGSTTGRCRCCAKA